LVAFDITHFSEPPNPEWVESAFQNGATTEANVVFAWAPDNVTIAAQAISSTHRYRCVTTGSHPVPPPTP
jgi:hypothetical protein